ncbi:hypothetical protein [Alloactinosynnema sp. L-07]|uniref:hypothetical protein n=1 Tax=Alloactinosynnema sp. L-07 TaxID=1653480 RepID=UPI00065EFEC8|nr:hypothetical protein [Alloactinosynnema sp. L-07]CRK59035.1 hypothetical protein [Alloactinosynnema sp. L-07]
MTAAVNGRKLDALAVLTRADKRWCDRKKYDTAAEPEYVAFLAAAVKPLLIGDHDHVPTPAADPAQLQRLEDLVAELRKQVEGSIRTVERQKGEHAALKMERDQIRNELTAARKTAPDAKHLDALREEINRLQGRLSDAEQRATEARTARDNALARVIQLDQALTEERAETPHMHAWVLDPDNGNLDDCDCGLAFPPDTLAAEQEADDEHPRTADPEPMAVLFAQLRRDLAGWGAAT